MKMNKKTLKADSGKPFQGGEISSCGRSLLGECYHLKQGCTATWSTLHKAQGCLDLAERKETGCRGGR